MVDRDTSDPSGLTGIARCYKIWLQKRTLSGLDSLRGYTNPFLAAMAKSAALSLD